MIEVVYPWAFILLLLPLIVWYFKQPKDQITTVIRTPLFETWNNLTQSNAKLKTNHLNKLLMFILWACLVSSVARIQWIDEAIELPKSGRDLLLAIDISGSMQEEDLKLKGRPADRLSVVKSILSEFIKLREGDRIGLILFGENAYLQTPLTFDLNTVNYMLDETEIGLAGAQRTAIGDGIGLSVKRLQERPEKKHVLILLTDGNNNSGVIEPIEAAKLAKHAGITIYTIGVGADEAYRKSFLFGSTKFNPSAGLDEKTLNQVAKITGGRYFRARNTQDLAKIYQILDQLEPIEDKPEVYRPVQELYYYPAAIGLALLFMPAIFNLFKSFWLILIYRKKHLNQSEHYNAN